MYKGKKILGLIPARGGSKRIPKKNIVDIFGKPLLAYTIEAAKNCPLFDRVIVTTDSEEIAEVARCHNCDVPFLRPAHLAEDSTSDHPVILHALEELKKAGEEYDYVVWLRPTAPLRETADIEAAIKTLIDGEHDIVRSVSEMRGINHPYWMYADETESGRLKPLVEGKSIKEYFQGQLLPKGFFALNGVVDALSVSHVLNTPFVWAAEKMGYIIIPPERAHDIDEEIDVLIVEEMLRIKFKSKE